jgi:hypothetical protein
MTAASTPRSSRLHWIDRLSIVCGAVAGALLAVYAYYAESNVPLINFRQVQEERESCNNNEKKISFEPHQTIGKIYFCIDAKFFDLSAEQQNAIAEKIATSAGLVSFTQRMRPAFSYLGIWFLLVVIPWALLRAFRWIITPNWLPDRAAPRPIYWNASLAL